MTKDELIKELKRIMPCICLNDYKRINRSDPNCSWCVYGEDLADFIIEDRKKIVEPIIAYRLSVIEIDQSWGTRKSDIAINQTLKNAGVEI